MGFWSFWVSGAALASLPVAHWFLMRRTFGVSGRFTALVDALRFRDEAPSEIPHDQAALIEALRAQTALALGPDALEAPSSEDAHMPLPVAAPQTVSAHILFLFGLTLGGALSVALGTGWHLTPGLRSEALTRVVDGLGIPVPAVLLFGGGLVGFGTRMAGGCTSGHGLCGVSQFQSGSLLATAAFFGAGVALSLALGAL